MAAIKSTFSLIEVERALPSQISAHEARRDSSLPATLYGGLSYVIGWARALFGRPPAVPRYGSYALPERPHVPGEEVTVTLEALAVLPELCYISQTELYIYGSALTLFPNPWDIPRTARDIVPNGPYIPGEEPDISGKDLPLRLNIRVFRDLFKSPQLFERPPPKPSLILPF